MTISRQDVYALSRGPGPGGVPLRVAEADRVAAVLNHCSTHRQAPQASEAAAPGTLAEDGHTAAGTRDLLDEL